MIAVPTGVNNRVAAYAYRGGSVFDRRDFYVGAALIKHPQGDLLVDAGFGRDIAERFGTMPRYFRAITRYRLWKPAADQLEAAGYDFGRLEAILLTHAHWDHMSGMPDFPGLPVMVTARDKAFFDESRAPGHLGPPGFGPPFTEIPFNWQVFGFEGGPYLGFARSHDVYGDGSVVCVPAPGHTPGSIIPRRDAAEPARDGFGDAAQRAYAEMATLPNVTAEGLILRQARAGVARPPTPAG